MPIISLGVERILSSVCSSTTGGAKLIGWVNEGSA
jgi:hypothetical protein